MHVWPVLLGGLAPPTFKIGPPPPGSYSPVLHLACLASCARKYLIAELGFSSVHGLGDHCALYHTQLVQFCAENFDSEVGMTFTLHGGLLIIEGAWSLISYGHLVIAASVQKNILNKDQTYKFIPRVICNTHRTPVFYRQERRFHAYSFHWIWHHAALLDLVMSSFYTAFPMAE